MCAVREATVALLKGTRGTGRESKVPCRIQDKHGPGSSTVGLPSLPCQEDDGEFLPERGNVNNI